MSTKNPRLQQLKEQAQKALERQNQGASDTIIEEFQIYQAELEIQNQQLIDSKKLVSEQHKHFQRLFNHVPVAIITTSKEGIITNSNLAAQSLLQSNKTLTGSSVYRHLEADDGNWLFNALNAKDFSQVSSPTFTLKHSKLPVSLLIDKPHQKSEEHKTYFIVITDQRSQIAIQRYKDIVEAFFQHDIALTAEITADGLIVNLNEKFQKDLGVTNQEATDSHISNILPRSIHQQFTHQIKTINTRTDGVQNFEISFRNRHGLLRHYNAIAFPPNNTIPNINFFLIDTTEQKETDEQLRVAMRVFKEGQEGIIITDADQQITMVNQAFEDITGYKKSEISGIDPSVIFTDTIAEKQYKKISRAMARSGHWSGEITNSRKDGTSYTVRINISSVQKNNTTKNYIAVFSDITEYKKQQDEIHRLAFYDHLTGCTNRSLFEDRVNHRIAKSKRDNSQFSLLFIDLDNFKDINDLHGHHIGDYVLKKVADRIRQKVRQADTVCRFGGDEFTILMPGMNQQGIKEKANSIIAAVCEEITIEDVDIKVAPSASIGITTYPDNGTSYNEIMRKADIAMYQAKNLGKGTLSFFDERLAKHHERSLTIANQLKKALQDNALEVYYQPQIDLKSGNITGVEALVRWTSPTLGAVSPAEFIPIAEQSVSIEKLGAYVLKSSLKAIKDINKKFNSDISLSVNISPRQFSRENFFNTIQESVESSQFPAHLLELEITESTAMDAASHAITTVQKLQKLNIGLSIDDFGTGHSSLSKLKALQFSTLKIDKSFIDEIGKSTEDQAICLAILTMAKTLGKTTVAEGVETHEQLQFLKQHGCDIIQGHYYSKAIPIDDLSDLIKQKRQNL